MVIVKDAIKWECVMKKLQKKLMNAVTKMAMKQLWKKWNTIRWENDQECINMARLDSRDKYPSGMEEYLAFNG
jgi:hypothetical protein